MITRTTTLWRLELNGVPSLSSQLFFCLEMTTRWRFVDFRRGLLALLVRDILEDAP